MKQCHNAVQCKTVSEMQLRHGLVLCLVFIVWCLLFGVWSLVFGVWCLVFGVWSFVQCSRRLRWWMQVITTVNIQPLYLHVPNFTQQSGIKRKSFSVFRIAFRQRKVKKETLLIISNSGSNRVRGGGMPSSQILMSV